MRMLSEELVQMAGGEWERMSGARMRGVYGLMLF
ncbi:hypothetical protein ABID23_000996 [Bartonella silvatica]|uniref:Uncharacterized protein n=1 Tax=Bartonella silvatica TaxID=357760 RepID=A0ABV2HHD7_9HYPH